MSTQLPTADKRFTDPDPRPLIYPELLDVRAVAELLGHCSKRHVYRLADAGRLPRPVKLGALVRWRRSDVMGWIAGGCPITPSVGRRS